MSDQGDRSRKSAVIVAGVIVLVFVFGFPFGVAKFCAPSTATQSWTHSFFCDVKVSDYFIALFTLVLAIVTYFLWRETERLAKEADDQSNKMRASIDEAAKSAKAMESVAKSMASNAESVKESLATNKQIAERQKLITELQSRAYLSVTFLGLVPQDATTGIRFEPRVNLVNLGNTPAYNVRFTVVADVLPFPIRDDFTYQLPTTLTSPTTLGPRLEKVITAVVPKMYPPIEEQQIRNGAGQRIVIWGRVEYEDAFKIKRTLKFAQACFFLLDGKTAMSTDAPRHNEAD
jgi:hypothetical protein